LRAFYARAPCLEQLESYQTPTSRHCIASIFTTAMSSRQWRVCAGISEVRHLASALRVSRRLLASRSLAIACALCVRRSRLTQRPSRGQPRHRHRRHRSLPRCQSRLPLPQHLRRRRRRRRRQRCRRRRLKKRSHHSRALQRRRRRRRRYRQQHRFLRATNQSPRLPRQPRTSTGSPSS